MIDLESLAAGRSRQRGPDLATWDRVLTEAQTLDPTTRDVVEFLLSIVGLNPADPGYPRSIFPHDTAPNERAFSLHMSSCGITREDALEVAGIAAPWVGKPYASRIGTALGAERAFAQAHGAWTEATHWTAGGELPHAGDGAFVGNPGEAPGVWARVEFSGAHVRTIVLVDGATLVGIDGGGPGIHWSHTEPVEVSGELWFKPAGSPLDASDMRPAKGRRCFGMSRLLAMPLTSSATADTDRAPPMDAGAGPE